MFTWAGEDRCSELVGEVLCGARMVGVRVGDEHRPGVGRREPEAPDRVKNEGQVGRVAAVDDGEPTDAADDDPVGSGSLDEVDPVGELNR